MRCRALRPKIFKRKHPHKISTFLHVRRWATLRSRYQCRRMQLSTISRRQYPDMLDVQNVCDEDTLSDKWRALTLPSRAPLQLEACAKCSSFGQAWKYTM